MEAFKAAKLPDFLGALSSDARPEETLSFLLDAWPEGVLVFDTSRRLLLANRTATTAFTRRGLTLGDSLAKIHRTIRLFDASTEEPLPDDSDPAVRALGGETVERTEYLVRSTRVGASAWIECRARPIFGRDGEVRGAIVTVRDITLRKQREIRLTSADQLSDFIYHGNLAGIFHTTIDGRILDCNEAIVRMLGYASKEELKTVRMQQLYFDPEERNRMLRLIQGPGRLNEFEVCFRRRDGARVWALINVCLLKPLQDRVSGNLVATVIDITERRIWEDTVRQSEQRFTAFMHNLPGVAFIKDLNGKYVYFNEALWRLFGKRPEDIVGKTDEAIWSSEDAERYRESDAKVIQTGHPIEIVEQAQHSDGPHSWLISKFPIDEEGTPAFVGGIGVDITGRLALENQLMQAGKMEALGRLAGGVAHDFNNLLTLISGYGQIALESIGTAANERMAGYLQEILTSARRAASLTQQLLAFSRRQPLDPKVLDLCELVHGIRRLLQGMIGEHIELTLQCSGRCLIHADAQQIEQVLMNLSLNARDAMPLGGTLRVECRALEEPVKRQGAGPLGVLIEVRDTGIGMDGALKARIFEPFFTSKEKARGTGLGLSTVYGTVTQAGGAIEVESEPGEGTIFRIYLPSANGTLETKATRPAARKSRGAETVLLAEDDASVRPLVEAMLRRLGFKVLVADTAAAAIELWQANRSKVDVLLTDVIMPHMGGGELAKTLREMSPGLKVLFMSGYADDMIENYGVQGNEVQLIPKPFNAEELGRRLRGVLDS